MTRDIRRRLTALEARRGVGAPKIEVWVNEGNGLLRNRAGAVMTREAFDAAFPNARKFKLNAGCRITILGRADQCTATNACGATSHDVCLAAEDMERAEE